MLNDHLRYKSLEDLKVFQTSSFPVALGLETQVLRSPSVREPDTLWMPAHPSLLRVCAADSPTVWQSVEGYQSGVFG